MPGPILNQLSGLRHIGAPVFNRRSADGDEGRRSNDARLHQTMAQDVDFGLADILVGILEHGPWQPEPAITGSPPFPCRMNYLIQAMQYQVADGLSQQKVRHWRLRTLSKLKHLMHPLIKIMDAESHKICSLAMKSYSGHQHRTAGTPVDNEERTGSLPEPSVPVDAGNLADTRKG